MDDAGPGKIVDPPRKKIWVQPSLQKLPIAATAGDAMFNEGQGGGKGESGDPPAS